MIILTGKYAYNPINEEALNAIRDYYFESGWENKLALKIAKGEMQLLILNSAITRFNTLLPDSFVKLGEAIKESDKSMLNLAEQMQEIKTDYKLKRDQNRKNWHWKGKRR